MSKVCEAYECHLIVLAAVVVGFERRTYTVGEGDGQVELCVNITLPRRQDIGTVTFNLTVETRAGSAGIIATAVFSTKNIVVLID